MAGVLGSVLVVVLVVWAVARPSGPSAGPLVAYRSGLSAAAQIPVGEAWSWALISLQNPTDEQVDLDGIKVQSSDPGFVGSVLVEQWRTKRSGKLVFPNLSGDGGMATAWPPPDAQPGDLVIPSKAVIPPHKMVYVFVELVPPTKGHFLAGPGVVDYHIGSDHHQVTSRNWQRVCAPETAVCKTKGMPY